MKIFVKDVSKTPELQGMSFIFTVLDQIHTKTTNIYKWKIWDFKLKNISGLAVQIQYVCIKTTCTLHRHECDQFELLNFLIKCVTKLKNI